MKAIKVTDHVIIDNFDCQEQEARRHHLLIDSNL